MLFDMNFFEYMRLSNMWSVYIRLAARKTLMP